MRELGLEEISGTPGTAASLTVTAVTSPYASPRMSQVASLGVPIHYIIEASNGQVLATGVGYCSVAGTFVRQYEFTQWSGTTYTKNPATLYNLPSGCKLYCGPGEATFVQAFAPPSNVDADRWVEPGGRDTVNSGYAPSGTNRDHFWRFRNLCGFKTDAVGLYLGAAAIGIDFGLYDIDWATGNPGVLLLGWPGVTSASGDNILLYSAATSGILAKTAQTLPLGDLFACYNVASTTATISRGVAAGSTMVGGGVIALNSCKPMLYQARTQGAALSDPPSGLARHSTSISYVPLVALRGA